MADDQKVRDAQLKQSIQQKLIESGEYERLKEILRQKLIDSGWRDELKEHTMSAPPPLPRNTTAAAQYFAAATAHARAPSAAPQPSSAPRATSSSRWRS
jgi:hypothetical protein